MRFTYTLFWAWNIFFLWLFFPLNKNFTRLDFKFQICRQRSELVEHWKPEMSTPCRKILFDVHILRLLKTRFSILWVYFPPKHFTPLLMAVKWIFPLNLQTPSRRDFVFTENTVWQWSVKEAFRLIQYCMSSTSHNPMKIRGRVLKQQLKSNWAHVYLSTCAVKVNIQNDLSLLY